MWSKLPSVYERANPIDLPRRACTSCRTPLPEELDELDAVVLAVVGLNRGGKTYFIGSSLTAASRNDGLARHGVTAFTPLEDTAERLHQHYFSGLFRGGFKLDTTPVDDHLTRPPLMFKVTMYDGQAFLLLVHDVSGEALMNRSSRTATAGFVSRADAIIFLADPTDMDHVERELPLQTLTEAGGGSARSLDQASLLDAVLNELRPVNPERLPPLAVTISKSDLLEVAFGGKPRMSTSGLGEITLEEVIPFSKPMGDGDWREEIRVTSEQVRKLLRDLNENKLVSLGESHTPSSFHAISVLGSKASRQARGGRPAPVRVMDPLGTVLEQIRAGRARDN